jgi:hypothetical protein
MIMAAPAIDLFVGSSMLLRATVTDKDGNVKIGATVKVTLVHAFGVNKDQELDCSEMAVPITWPVTLNDVGKGKYEYIFAGDLPIVEKERYKCKTDVTLGATKRYSEPYCEAVVDRD